MDFQGLYGLWKLKVKIWTCQITGTLHIIYYEAVELSVFYFDKSEHTSISGVRNLTEKIINNLKEKIHIFASFRQNSFFQIAEASGTFSMC